MTASGLPKRSPVSVTLTSTDAAHVTWTNRLKLTTDAHGSLRVPMSALTHMLPSLTLRTSYTWTGAASRRFRLQVAGAGTATFERRFLGVPIKTRKVTLAKDGLEGTYIVPAGAKKHAAILLFGGSDGGLSQYVTCLGTVLAGHGYPVLTLAYFAAPGLPPEPVKIPLEYFARGLRWLRAQPEADPRHLVIYGISLGSEPAQLTAAYYPQLVRAVVASVPGNLIGYWTGRGSEWTYRGRHFPPFAPIPIERFHGPVFALCATKDINWPSCPQARAIMARRRSHHIKANDSLVVARGAGHYVSATIPYTIAAPNLNNTEADADNRESTHTWPQLLAFLRSNA